MKPNFDLFDKFSIFDKKLKENPQEAMDLLETPEFADFAEYITITDNGIQWNKSKMGAFLILGAETGGESSFFGGHSGVIDPDTESNFYSPLSTFGIDEEAESKRVKDKFKVNIGENLFRGLVYIPLTDQTSLAMFASDEYPTHTGTHNVEYNMWMEDVTRKQNSFVNNSDKL
jgi:hypothetical protein